MLIEGKEDIKAIVLDSKDNTATALAVLPGGDKVKTKHEAGYLEIFLRQEIALGHKFAIKGIAKGEDVVKYGFQIGRATEDIEQGSWVHVHNVESLRGRGDLVARAAGKEGDCK